jgi:hypothetical protein
MFGRANQAVAAICVRPEGQLIRFVRGYAAKVEHEMIREQALRAKRARVDAGKLHNHGSELYGDRRDKAAGVCHIKGPETVRVCRLRPAPEAGAALRGTPGEERDRLQRHHEHRDDRESTVAATAAGGLGLLSSRRMRTSGREGRALARADRGSWRPGEPGTIVSATWVSRGTQAALLKSSAAGRFPSPGGARSHPPRTKDRMQQQ